MTHNYNTIGYYMVLITIKNDEVSVAEYKQQQQYIAWLYFIFL